MCDYVTCYCTKADAPDVNIISNIIARRFLHLEVNGTVTQRDQMKVVANAVYSATHMGAQMANFILMGGNVCTFTRPEVTVNPMRRSDMRKTLPRQNSRSSPSARSHSVGSQLGRRDAYARLAAQQVSEYGECHVTLFHMLTYYSFKDLGTRADVAVAPHLRLDDVGAPNGEAPEKFCAGDVIFSRYAKAHVVRMSPHVPLNNNCERSAFATLLLHTPWTNEDDLSPSGTTSVAVLKEACDTELLPAYVAAFQKRQLAQQDNLTGDEVIEEDMQNGANGEPEDDLRNEEGGGSSLPVIDESVVREAFEGVAHGNVVLEHLSLGRVARAHDFIAIQRENHRNQSEVHNKLNDEEVLALQMHPDNCIPVADESDSRVRLDKILGEMNEKQRDAFDVVNEHIQANRQLIMFLTGGGGTGKSHVIKALVHKARIKWGKALGAYGSALVVAPTGNAAFNVRGHTWHSALSKTPKQTPLKLSAQMMERLGTRFKGLRLLILDEVRWASFCELFDVFVCDRNLVFVHFLVLRMIFPTRRVVCVECFYGFLVSFIAQLGTVARGFHGEFGRPSGDQLPPERCLGL